MTENAISQKATAEYRAAWRIKYHLWKDDSSFAGLLQLIDHAPDAFDEIMFFAGEYVFHHGYWPLEELAPRFAHLKERMQSMEQRGKDVTVNILSTHGAECYGLPDDAPRLPYDGSISWTGDASEKVASAADPKYLEWTAELHRMAAETGGKVIWIDDHICAPARGSGDFSESSLRGFDDGQWDRDSLVKALNDPANDDLRRRWLGYQTAVLANYCKTVADAARGVNPRVRIGLMTVGFTNIKHQGDFYVECFETMKGECARPGHGFYRDDDPPGLLQKQMEVSAQVARYPDHVEEILYEFEDWPSNRLFKSIQTVDNEITGAIMNGCTGVAMSYLHEWARDFQEYNDVAERMAARKPFYKKLVQSCRGLAQAGALNVQTPRYAENVWSEETAWIEIPKTYDSTQAWRWVSLGMPFTGDAGAASAAVLTGQTARGLSRDELERLLCGGLLLDEGAVRECWKHGLGELTGVKPLEYVAALYERFQDHPVNEGFIGHGRSPVWWGGIPVEPISEDTEIVSRLIRFDDNVDFGASTTLYRNDRGGRIVHLGLDAWFYMGLTHKATQLRRLLDWASDGQFPLEIPGGQRIAPTLRRSADGSRFVLLLQNFGFDPARNFRVILRTSANSAKDLATDEEIPLNRMDEEQVELEIPEIAPWCYRVVASSSFP